MGFIDENGYPLINEEQKIRIALSDRAKLAGVKHQRTLHAPTLCHIADIKFGKTAKFESQRTNFTYKVGHRSDIVKDNFHHLIAVKDQSCINLVAVGNLLHDCEFLRFTMQS